MNNVMKQAQRFVENIWPRTCRSPDCNYDEQTEEWTEKMPLSLQKALTKKVEWKDAVLPCMHAGMYKLTLMPVTIDNNVS